MRNNSWGCSDENKKISEGLEFLHVTYRYICKLNQRPHVPKSSPDLTAICLEQNKNNFFVEANAKNMDAKYQLHIANSY